MGLVLRFAINKSLMVWLFCGVPREYPIHQQLSLNCFEPMVILVKSVISLGVEKWLFPKSIICPTLIRACIFHNGELFLIIQGKLQSPQERKDQFLPLTLQHSEWGPRRLGPPSTEGVVSFLCFFKYYHCLKIFHLFNILQSFIVIILFYGKQIFSMIKSLRELQSEDLASDQNKVVIFKMKIRIFGRYFKCLILKQWKTSATFTHQILLVSSRAERFAHSLQFSCVLLSLICVIGKTQLTR